MKLIIFATISLFLLSAALFAQVNTESFRIKSDSIGFSVMADLELSLMAGNTDFQHFGSNSRVNYNWTQQNHTFLIINGGFGRKDGETFYSQALFHLRHVNVLSKSLLLEIFMQYDNNKSLLLLDRALTGAGLRYKLFTSDNIISRVGLSLFSEREVYDLTSQARHSKKSNTTRFNGYLTVNFKISKEITFLSVTYFQPDVLETGDFRVLSNNALKIKLTQNFSLNIKVDGRYDSDPADSIKEYDISSKIGLMIAID